VENSMGRAGARRRQPGVEPREETLGPSF
jgi:hypothetical protein